MQSAADEELETPLMAMIDIVFLLIIFFLVTAMAEQDTVDISIKLAKSYEMENFKKPPQAIVVNLKWTKHNDGASITMSKVHLSLKEFEFMLKKRRNTFGNDVPIILRCDANVRYREVEKLNAVIGRAGFYNVYHTSESAVKPRGQ